GRERGAGAAGGTAGEAAQVPRVARRRPGQIERGPAEGELVRRELADDDSAGLTQPLDREGVFLWHIVLHDLGMAGRGDAGGLVDVLEADRDAVQRSAIFAGGDLGFGGTRLMARRVGEHSDEAVQPAVEPRDAIKPAVD